MTDLTRRSFLRGLLTVAAVSIAPATILHADIPRIVGDGIHDDTLGLQAALDGKPFVCEGCVVSNTHSVYIGPGIYRISGTLNITDAGPDCMVAGAHLECEDIPGNDPAIYATNMVRKAHLTTVSIHRAPTGIQFPIASVPNI